jgi:hypothetical protein
MFLDVNADYIDKYSLPYVLDPLTESQIKDCESIHKDFVSLPDSDFYARYQTHNFSGNCVMLYEDSLWDYEDSDRYEKLSERSTELIQEQETKLKQSRENFYVNPKSLTELQIPGTFLFKFEGCTGDQTINARDISVESDKETVLLTKFVGEEREIPPGVCNELEIQIRADDPQTIRVMIFDQSVELADDQMADLEPMKATPKLQETERFETTSIRLSDLSYTLEPLTDRQLQECERAHNDYITLDGNEFSTRYLYHGFMGNCVMLFEDPVWDSKSAYRYDILSDRLAELVQEREQQLTDSLIKKMSVAAASDVEVVSLIRLELEGSEVPAGICRVMDVRIQANDPDSIRVLVPGEHTRMIDHDEKSMDQKEMGMMKNDLHMSPKFQMRQGIAINQIECNDGLQLMFKASDGLPACVKESNMEKLVQRGWGKPA